MNSVQTWWSWVSTFFFQSITSWNGVQTPDKVVGSFKTTRWAPTIIIHRGPCHSIYGGYTHVPSSITIVTGSPPFSGDLRFWTGVIPPPKKRHSWDCHLFRVELIHAISAWEMMPFTLRLRIPVLEGRMDAVRKLTLSKCKCGLQLLSIVANALGSMSSLCWNILEKMVQSKQVVDKSFWSKHMY